MEVGTDTQRQNYSVLSTGLRSFTSPFFLCFVILWRNERDAFTSNLADLQMLSAGLQQPTSTGPDHQSNMTDVCFITVVLRGHKLCDKRLLSAWEPSPRSLHPSHGIELRASTAWRVQRVRRQRPHWPPRLKR